MCPKEKISDYIFFLISFFIVVNLGQNNNEYGYLGLIFTLIIWGHYYINNPVFAFMLALSVYLNVGAYLGDLSFGLPGYFRYKYFFLILSFLVLYSPRLNRTSIWKDPDVRKIVICVGIMSLYQIVISIYFQLSPSPVGFVKLVYRNIPKIFGFILIFPAYALVKYDYRKFIYIILMMCLAIESAFYITLLTPLELIEVWNIEERFLFSGVYRTYFQSTGYIGLILSIVTVMILLRLRLALNKKLFYAAGIMMMGNIMLSLTRTTIITTFGNIIFIIYFIKSVFKLKFGRFVKLGLLVGIGSIILLTIFPDLSDNTFLTYKRTYSDFFGAEDDVSSLTRFTYELPRHLSIIKDNVWIGTGFQSFWDSYEYGKTDMPLTANLGIYGVLGMFIYSFIYFFGIRYILRWIKILRRNIKSVREEIDPHLIIIFFVFAIPVLSKIILNPIYFSNDLISETGRASMGFTFGIVYGTTRLIQERLSVYRVSGVTTSN